ncbi:MAG: hypothetical protein AB7O66_04335 [Limisphaerales bacterium]
MNERRRTTTRWIAGWKGLGIAAGAAAWIGMGIEARADDSATLKPILAEDFSSVAVGSMPDGFLILNDNNFQVKEEDGNRFLHLPGAPLDDYGVMFGSGASENWGAQARIHATRQGRRFPAFGVSVNGVAGYRVQVAPAKRAIEIFKGDEVKASVEYAWESGTWTLIRVQVKKTGEGRWLVQGKAWPDGSKEPADWLVTWEETETPIAGRAAIWGKPFAGTEIRFDDLKVLPVGK